MKHFLTKTSIMTLIVIVVLTCLCLPYNIIPFEASISLDSKLYELKKRGGDSIETIAIGSSMTLNNLNSKIVVDNLSNDAFYNISSWGQSLSQDYQLLQIVVPLYKPKRVFIVTFPGDLVDKKYNTISDIKTYLCTENSICELYLMMKYKLQTKFLNEDMEYISLSASKHSYEYLGYDDYGGVSLDITNETISMVRWNAYSLFKFDKSYKGYEDLLSICEYLAFENIELIFVMSPSRFHYYENNLDDLQMHIAYCDSIISQYEQHTFINEVNFELYNDTLFADHSHLNKKGSEIFTTNILKKYTHN